jgi:hypothetical protein
VAAFVITSKTVELGTGWTGTAPGANVTISGTVTSGSDISAYLVGGPDPGWDVDQVETTNNASGGYTEVIPGITTGDDLVLDCNSDQAASALDQIIRTTLGGVSVAGSSPIYVDIKPTSAARSTTNPSFVAAVYISKWAPYSGDVGDRAAGQLTLTITGKFDTLTA